jgi:uncharacterized protein (DUF1800 family)
MNRQDFLSSVTDVFTSDDKPTPPDRSPSQFANKVIPSVARTTAGLEQYTGPWGRDQAAHVLRRTMFGPAKVDIDGFSQSTMLETVNRLLAPPSVEASQPLNYDSHDIVPVGSTWVNALYKDPNPAVTYNPTGTRTTSLKAWWMNLMINQPPSIREKMVLFWHNHFVTEMNIVSDPRYSYLYVSLLRNNALGNFQTLVRQMSVEGAMLRYLNGNSNTASSPNENYGRELQELFTIGKGPEIAPGDYTYYTEADVKAAARVLTGWRDTANTDGTVGPVTATFFSARHDTTDKQFSAHYGNTIIKGSTDGGAELDSMLAMIFAQPETVLYICRKLYRWFVYYVIDPTTESNVIGPMATLLTGNNYNILPVLDALFKSAHFYDPVNMGCMIKNPVDFAAGIPRLFSLPIPASPVATQYAMWTYFVNQASSMDMFLGDPPNVAGWASYYQEPEYNELWINSDTLPKRTRLTDTLMQSGYTTGGATMKIDAIAFVKTLSNPSDPNVIVNETAQLLFANAITANQQAFLKETLLPGLPDYEWAAEWNAYLANPTDPTALNSVQSKLVALIKFMMEMPEFQLS